MTNSLILPRTLVQQLFAHAQSQPDVEVCGLLGRADNGELRHYPVRNTAAQPAQLFTLDSAEQIRIMQAMREAGEVLFAIYHSHPTAPATPSARDLEESGYPDAWQFIISLNTKGVLELRAWQFVDGEAREAPLRIIED